MTPRRLIANIATALVLTAIVVLVLFAHLSTLVVPEQDERFQQDIPFRRTP
jgi:multisubunit Na+/H+ antiporter MnhC subunit